MRKMLRVVAAAASVVVSACSGAAVGVGPANGPDGDGSAGAGAGAGGAEGAGTGAGGGGGAGAPVDTGGIALVDCGPLGRHVFCDDLGGALPSRFDRQDDSAGSLNLDAADFVSGPGALASTTAAITNGTRTYARLHKDIAASGRRFVLAFSEKVEASCVGPWDLVQTSSIVLGGDYFLTVAHGPNEDSVVETSLAGGLYIQVHALASRLPRDAWARVVLDVDGAAKTMSLYLEGAPIMKDEPLKYAPAGVGSTATPAVEAGLLVDNVTFKPSACTVLTDDVTFDVQP